MERTVNTGLTSSHKQDLIEHAQDLRDRYVEEGFKLGKTEAQSEAELRDETGFDPHRQYYRPDEIAPFERALAKWFVRDQDEQLRPTPFARRELERCELEETFR